MTLTTNPEPDVIPPPGPQRRRRQRGKSLRRRPGHYLLMVLAALPLAVLVAMAIALVAELTGTENSLETISRILRRDRFWTVVRDTAIFVAITVAVAFVVGVVLAVLLERTRGIPGVGRVADFLPLTSLLMPPLIGTLGWIFLFTPRTGVGNHVLRAVGLGEFNVYSHVGLFTVASVYLIPYVYTLTAAALANSDTSQEEAARMSGAGPVKTILTVTLPAIKPALLSSLLIATMASLAEFSVPMLIGTRFGYSVVTVEIYRAAKGSFPADYVTASLLASGIIAISVLGLFLQRRALAKGSYESVRGKGAHSLKIDLGRWRFLAAIYVWAIPLLLVVLPMLMVFYVSLSRFWASSPATADYTLLNYEQVFSNPLFRQALTNSLMLALMSATVVVVLSFAVAYLIEVAKVRFVSTLVDYGTNLPLGIPHIVFGLGMLLVLLNFPFFYGSRTGLLVAYIVLFLPYGTRSMTTALRQIGRELEEASFISGAGLWRTMQSVLWPLVRVAAGSAWGLVFILAFRELSASVMLANSASNVVSNVMIGIYQGGSFTLLAAFGGIVLVVNLAVLALSRLDYSAIATRTRNRRAADSSHDDQQNNTRRVERIPR